MEDNKQNNSAAHLVTVAGTGIVKKILLLLSLLLCLYTGKAQVTVKEIKQKMAQVRKETDWDDADKAKKANETLDKLTKQLYLAAKKEQQAGPSDTLQQKTEAENFDRKLEMFNNIFDIARKGKDTANVDLAKPTRAEIAKAYLEDEKLTVKNNAYYEEVTQLVINMNDYNVKQLIALMRNYKKIQTLIITCKTPVAVNLNDLLNKAAHYPLENLYIINFGLFVKELPAVTGNFKELKNLVVYKNDMHQLPSSLSGCIKLQEIYIDKNPVRTLYPVVTSLKKLTRLSIVQTGISEAEAQQIKKSLPNCEIIIQ